MNAKTQPLTTVTQTLFARTHRQALIVLVTLALREMEPLVKVTSRLISQLIVKPIIASDQKSINNKTSVHPSTMEVSNKRTSKQERPVGDK